MNRETILQRLRRLDTCALSDAVDQLNLPAAVSGLVPRIGARRICGRVLTVTLAAGVAQQAASRHLCTATIEAALPGDVIVVEQRTGVDAAGWGGMLSNAARLRGISGVIVEGPARDIDEAAELGFPIFSRSTTSRTARGRVHEIANGVPISVGELTVAQNDYVAADSSGVVFIPAAAIEALLDAAENIAFREAAMTKQILTGRSVGSVMGNQYELMLKGGVYDVG